MTDDLSGIAAALANEARRAAAAAPDAMALQVFARVGAGEATLAQTRRALVDTWARRLLRARWDEDHPSDAVLAITTDPADPRHELMGELVAGLHGACGLCDGRRALDTVDAVVAQWAAQLLEGASVRGDDASAEGQTHVDSIAAEIEDRGVLDALGAPDGSRLVVRLQRLPDGAVQVSVSLPPRSRPTVRAMTLVLSTADRAWRLRLDLAQWDDDPVLTTVLPAPGPQLREVERIHVGLARDL